MRNNEVRSELFWNDVRSAPRTEARGGCDDSDASAVDSRVTVMAAAKSGEAAPASGLRSRSPDPLPCESHVYENVEDLKLEATNADSCDVSCEYQRYADPCNIGLVFPAELETDDELLKNYIDGNIYGTDRDLLRRFIHSVNQDPKTQAAEDDKPKDAKVKEALSRQNIYRRNAELSKNAELLKNVQFNLDLLDANINYELEKIQALVESEAAELENAHTIRYCAPEDAFENDTDTEKPSIDSSSNTTTDDSSSKSLALEDSMGSLVQYLNSSDDTISGNSVDKNSKAKSVDSQSRQSQKESKNKVEVKTKQSCIVV